MHSTVRLLLTLPVVVAGVAACGSSTPSAPPAPPPPPPAALLNIRIHPGGTRLNTALTTQPVVEVLDATNHLFTSGSVPVTAVVASGGGTLSGQTTVSSVNGLATFSDLSVVSTTAGERTLSFSAPSLPSVRSSAFSLAAGTPATLRIITAPTSPAQAMFPLATAPVVQVIDDGGSAIINPTPVTATIVSGNGMIAAGGTATTGADGRATFTGFTLGALRGVTGAVKVRFAANATAFADVDVTLGCYVQPLAIGTSISDRLGDGDCYWVNRPGYMKLYTSSANAGSAFTITQDASFRSWPMVNGYNDGQYWGFFYSGNRASYKTLLPGGNFRVAASTVNDNETGTYSLSLTQATADVRCEDWVVFPPQALTGTLSSSDCAYVNSTRTYDTYDVPLLANATVTATVTATAFPPFVGIYVDTGYVLFRTASAGGSATLTFRATTSRIYDVDVSSAAPDSRMTGSYTVSLVVTQPSAVAAERRVYMVSSPTSRRHGEPSRPRP